MQSLIFILMLWEYPFFLHDHKMDCKTKNMAYVVFVVQSLSCVGLWDPMEYSTPGSFVLHYLPEFAEVHSTESVMLSNHLILSLPLLLLPSVFPSIKVFSMFSSVQSLSRVRLFATPWIAAHQASLSITNSWSLLKLTSIESVMPSSHLILCRPLLLLPPIPPSIRVFSSESTLRMRWPKYWSFSFSISLSNEHPGLISFRMD